MKTQIYLTTLLALIIQVMVNGQTPGNQTNKKVRILPTLGVINAGTNQKASIGLEAAVGPAQKNAVVGESAQNTVYYNAGSCKELLAQAEELLSDVRILRTEAENNSGPEKENYLKQANIIYKQAEANQIKAAEIAGKIYKEQYRINSENLSAILLINKSNDYTTNQAKDLIFDAGMNIRLGQEMREEAYAMPTGAAKLGSLVNAEEKETLAINQQKKAVDILKAANPQLVSNINGILAGNIVAIR